MNPLWYVLFYAIGAGALTAAITHAWYGSGKEIALREANRE